MTKWLAYALQSPGARSDKRDKRKPLGTSVTNVIGKISANSKFTAKYAREIPADPHGWIDDFEEFTAMLEFDQGWSWSMA